MKKCKNIAILGAGHIAESMAVAINGLKDEVCAYAVSSRDLNKAKAFAEKWNFSKAYGSYDELVNDPAVDLIYIATPHSHHYEHAKLCLSHKKPCLVEKAFTANSKQTKELLDLAVANNTLITEAIWTRYMPSRNIVQEILDSNVLGTVNSLSAEFSIDLRHVERLCKPELAGGALLDLGMYTLTFASMWFGNDIASIDSHCQKYETGVDAIDETIFTYSDGKTAKLRSSMISGPINEGIIYGSKGKLVVKNLNNFSSIIRYDNEDNLLEEYPIPKQINGYEYELLSAVRAIEAGEIECNEMPHSMTLTIMKQMDELRALWGIKYPFE